MLFPSIGKIAGAAALMSVAVGVGVIGIGRLGITGRTADVISIFGLIPVAIGIYGWLLWVFHIEDRDAITGFAWTIAGRLGIKRKGGPK